MRKLMVLPLAGLLALGVVGPVAAGPNVSNTSGGGESIYGEWSAEGTYGYVFVGEDSEYGGYGDIYQEERHVGRVRPGRRRAGQGHRQHEDTTRVKATTGSSGPGRGATPKTSRSISRAGSTAGTRPARSSSTPRPSTSAPAIYGGDAVAEVATLDVTVTGAVRSRRSAATAATRSRRSSTATRTTAARSGGERDRRRRRLDRRDVRLRLHERGHLVGPHQQLTPRVRRRGPGPTPGASSCPVRSGSASCRRGRLDQANALTGRSSHSPPCVQLSALAS